MPIFDIILFALIAVFLVLRLRSTLGRRDGFNGRPDEGENGPDKPNEFGKPQNKSKGGPKDNVIRLPENRADDTPAVDVSIGEPEPAEEDAFEDGPLKDGIAAIVKADPSFTVRDFTDGSKMAFEMILSFYCEGNAKALKPLLSSEVYANFHYAIRDREEKEQTLEETLVGINSAQIVEATLVNNEAQITVKFVSEQISALRDTDGTVIEGDPAHVEKAVDFWTFSRNTRARDPNWALVATGSLD